MAIPKTKKKSSLVPAVVVIENFLSSKVCDKIVSLVQEAVSSDRLSRDRHEWHPKQDIRKKVHSYCSLHLRFTRSLH